MSEKLPRQNDSEEIDLGQFFSAIGNLFQRLFNFIGSIFKGIFSAIIYTIKPLVVHFKVVVVVLTVTVILGYIYEKTNDPVYYSEMLVKPYFDSKYQLSSNINYFNALISSKNVKELSSIFEIDTLSAKELIGFDLEAGPETQNDLFIEYDEYIKSIDTSLVDELTYKDYIDKRDFMSGKVFAIKAKSNDISIFPRLQEGFRKTFENEFSKHQKRVRDTMAYIDRLSLTTELSRLDSIQKTYLAAIREESKNRNLVFGSGSMLPLQEEKRATKEYELFLREQGIRYKLNELNRTIAEENTFFDILAPFDKLGKKDKSFEYRYRLLFPAIALVLFILWFLALKAFKYIKDYE